MQLFHQNHDPADQYAGVLEQMSASKREAIQPVLTKIEKEDWLPGRKKIYTEYLIASLKQEGPLPSLISKRLSVWGKNKGFVTCVKEQFRESREKFRICGMVSCMSATLVFYFAKAMATGHYLAGFSVDALVGVIAIVLLIHNIQLKYGLTRAYSDSRDFLYLDILALILCVLFKILLPVNLDLSLVVLVIAYFAEKKKFGRALQSMEQEIIGPSASS